MVRRITGLEAAARILVAEVAGYKQTDTNNSPGNA